MAIFRKPRRRQATGVTHSPVSGMPPADALRARLREIAAEAIVPEDALEPALRAILEATRAHAGAVLLYDPRQAILRLVAEVGLSDEGCRRLRSVRRGDPTSWDMPLSGLLNRRAYIIESANRNRYVPRLVEHVGSVRTVSCFPLFTGPTAVGSLVIVTLSPRAFGERDIRMLERPVIEVTAMIEAVRRRGGVVEDETITTATRTRQLADPAIFAERDQLRNEVSARLSERAVLAAELASKGGETERLRVELEAAIADRDRLTGELERAHEDTERAGSLAGSLATAERERARLAAALEAAAAERVEHAKVQSALEQARAEAERAAAAAVAELEASKRTSAVTGTEAVSRSAELLTEIDRLRAQVDESEAALARERTLVRERERERERLAHELRAAAVREQRLRDDLQAAAGRVDTAAEDAVRHALETARTADEARAAAAAEAESLSEALASGQEIVLALEDEAGRANSEVERLLAAARAASSESERLAVSLAEARARELASTARLAEAGREADTLRRESSRVTVSAREREAEVASLKARFESLAAERDRVRETLAATEAERDRLATDAARAPAEQAQLQEALERERAERARLSAAFGTMQSALGELEATLSRREAEATAQVAEIARLMEERGRLAAERPAAPVTAAPAPTPAAPSRETVRLVTVPPPMTSRTRARDVDPTRPAIALLDVEGTWAGVTVDGHSIAVVPPGDEVVDRIAAVEPGRIVVNLIAPGALDALSVLRAAGSTARFWGCLADTAADRALALGVVEPAMGPLDPDSIVEVLGKYAGRGTRVVTAGADVDALMSLRQALARGGLSVSMAWDGKQAADLLLVVRPEVVVVDLALPRRDGYGIVARLANVDPAPSAVVISAADDASAGFAAALADPGHGGRTLSLKQCLEALIVRSEAPVDRRQKVRVVGRK